jgi:hemoglobin
MSIDDLELYNSFGGEAGVVRLVDVFYKKVLADDELLVFFNGVPMERLKNMQKEFFTVALGGPGDYSDSELSHAHQGRNIKTRHFKTFVDLLFATLSEFELDEEERFQIISHINTYVDDIVGDAESLIG